MGYYMYRPASETPFEWCFTGGPIVALDFIPSDENNNRGSSSLTDMEDLFV